MATENLDMGMMEDYFRNEFNKVCVSHLVSRIVTDNGIKIIIYAESKQKILLKLKEMYESPDKLVDFGCQIKEDKNWTSVQPLLNS